MDGDRSRAEREGFLEWTERDKALKDAVTKQRAHTTKVETDYHNGVPVLETTTYGGIAGGRTQCEANGPHQLLHEQRERLLKAMNSGEISLLDVTMELFITLGLLEQQLPIGTGR